MGNQGGYVVWECRNQGGNAPNYGGSAGHHGQNAGIQILDSCFIRILIDKISLILFLKLRKS